MQARDDPTFRPALMRGASPTHVVGIGLDGSEQQTRSCSRRPQCRALLSSLKPSRAIMRVPVRFIDLLVGKAFNVVTLFGGNPETARRSSIGRVIIALGQ